MKDVTLFNSYVTLTGIMVLTFVLLIAFSGFINRKKNYMMRNSGIFIILLGIGLIFFTSFTSLARNKVIDIEKIEFVKNKPQNLNWYPLVGVAILGIGALVLQRSFER